MKVALFVLFALLAANSSQQQVETQRFVRRAAAVDVAQVTEQWFDGDTTRHRNPLLGVMVDPLRREVHIQTEYGTVHVPVGHWIVIEDGRLSTMHHDAFEASYIPVRR